MPKKKYWSSAVTLKSNAMNLESGVFRKKTARAVALSLKRSSDASTRRKSGPYKAAIGMLSFYLNRAGKNLKPAERKKLEQAKKELKKLYGRI